MLCDESVVELRKLLVLLSSCKQDVVLFECDRVVRSVLVREGVSFE